MAGKNDILATAGVDLSAFESGIAKLTSRLDAVEKTGSKAASGIEKVDKTANKLKNITVAQGLLTGLDRLAHGGGIASSSISELGKTMSLTSSGGGGFGLAKGLAAAADAAAMIPGPIGVVAAGVGLITKAVTEEMIANDRMAKKMAHGAFTAQGFLQKEIGLQDEVIDQKNKFFAFTGYNEAKIQKLEKARIDNAKQFTSFAKQDVKFTKDQSAGSNQRREAFDAEAESKQQIADIDAKLHENAAAGTSDAAIDRSLNSQKNIIQAQLEKKKQGLVVSEETEKSETRLNNFTAKRDQTLKSQLGVIGETKAELEQQLRVVESQNMGDSILASNLRSRINDQKLLTNEIEFQTAQALASSEAQNKVSEIAIRQDKSAVELAKEELQYAIDKAEIERKHGADSPEMTARDEQLRISKEQIAIEAKNESTQKALLGKKQQIGITQKDHLKDLEAELYAASELLRTSNDAGQKGTEINEQLRQNVHLKAKEKALAELALEDQEKSAHLAKDAAVQQQAGNQKLTTLAQIRAQYEVQITQAIREGRIEVAKQLTAQKQIAEVEAKIADLQKTPQQRAQDLKEQQKHDQLQGTVISRQNDREKRAKERRAERERLHPGSTKVKGEDGEIRDMTDDEILGRTDSTNRVSKSRKKQMDDFLKMHAPANADIAKIQNQAVDKMTVKEFNLNVLNHAP
jgi:hypothetical protein